MVAVPFNPFDFPRHYNISKMLLSIIVILWTVFLPSTIRSIHYGIFSCCCSLRFLILPNDIDISKIGRAIIGETNMHQIAAAAGVSYQYEREGVLVDFNTELNDINYHFIHDWLGSITAESDRRVNEWLYHHMDESPFHKLCYNSSITTRHINDYLTDNGNSAALAIDPYHGMTPLHVLSMNPHTPPDAIAALLDVNIEAASRLDNHGKLSLDYVRYYNVGGLVGMINGLCNHKHVYS